MGGQPAEAEDEPLSGTTIADRYHVVRVLARGGMGAVYEALQADLNRRVAIKVLYHGGDDHAEVRWLREAHAAGSIGHPNVVDVYDLGHLPDGRPYIVMPLLEGHDVATEIVRGVSVERALWILGEAAHALDALHAKGLVHRDLKPENLFIATLPGDREVVKLLDFGLATQAEVSRITGPGFVTGTPAYIAPEAVHGALPDRRGDVYALATLAYELLTGTAPFEGEAFRVLQDKVTKEPPRLELAGRSFPAEVEAVMARGLARSPEGRSPQAGRFVAELRAAFGITDRPSEPFHITPPLAPDVAARSITVTEDAPAAARRKTSRATLVGGTVGVLALVVCVTYALGLSGAVERTTARLHPRARPHAPPTSKQVVVAPPADAAVPAEAPAPPHVRRDVARPTVELPLPRDGSNVVEAAQLTQVATSALLRGATVDAIAGFEAATRTAPRYPPAWRGLGLANENIGRPTDAVRAYTHYLELAPSAPDAERIRERVHRLSH